MKHKFSVLSYCIILAMGIFIGCDNSSYDESPGNSKKPNTTPLDVTLDGTQQVPQPVQTPTTGSAELALVQETGELSGSVTVYNPNSTITAAHIHQSIAGTYSNPLIPLKQSNSNTEVWNVPDDTILSGDEVDSLLTGGMYINVHSTDHAAGEIRGQITSDSTEVIRVKLLGSHEVPAVNSAGDGIAYVTVNKDTADFTAVVHVNNLIATAAHIHQAFAGSNGSSAITLNQNTSDSFMWEAESTLSEDQLSALLSGEMYINVHTAANPDGEIRGQIAPASIKVIQTRLDGNQEVPDPVTTNGDGTGYITLDTVTGDIIATLRVDNLSDTITNAHIHQAAAGENGSIAVPLTADSADSGLWETNTTLTSAQQQALLHGEMYFNVHSSTFTQGELRGQILLPNFSFIQSTVFNTRCISCHSGPGASGGMRLDDNTYAHLVLNASNQNSALDRVAPGDPDNSYIIQKLEGTAATGSQMPPGGNTLQPVVIDNVRQWIAQGAEPH